MEVNDLAVRHSSSKSPSTLVRIGRTSIVALALVLAGSTAYAALAWRDGEVRHLISKDDPRARVTYVEFASWQGIVPSPDCPEYHYQEIQLPSGEWVKHGSYGRITRKGTALEGGSYVHGQRDGRWTFWNLDGSIDVERSGFYSNDARVQRGPVSPTDPAWVFAQRGA